MPLAPPLASLAVPGIRGGCFSFPAPEEDVLRAPSLELSPTLPTTVSPLYE